MTRARILFSERATNDISRLDLEMRERVLSVIRNRMGILPTPTNLDMKPLEGRPPWLRVRVGDVRVLCRRLTTAELRATGAERGYLIARVVRRRDLDRATARL